MELRLKLGGLGIVMTQTKLRQITSPNGQYYVVLPSSSEQREPLEPLEDNKKILPILSNLLSKFSAVHKSLSKR